MTTHVIDGEARKASDGADVAGSFTLVRRRLGLDRASVGGSVP